MTNIFFVVDVFSSTAFRGNPVMVVTNCEDLDVHRMQAFAAWNGMPETVYLRRNPYTPGKQSGSYAVRIFSPRCELPFAGHPSLAAAHIAVEAGFVSYPTFATDEREFGKTATLWQACAVGDVELKMLYAAPGAAKIFVKTPAPGQVNQLNNDYCAAMAKAIGFAATTDMYRVSAGANWVVLRLNASSQLGLLAPDMTAIEKLSMELKVSGITVYAPLRTSSGMRFEVRSFGPAIGVPEDAVCGGGNACVAILQHYLQDQDDKKNISYQNRQGRFVGRDGYVHIVGPVEDHRFWIGGNTKTMMTGKVEL
jgi:PhzF family phenazine biosynthesis protein